MILSSHSGWLKEKRQQGSFGSRARKKRAAADLFPGARFSKFFRPSLRARRRKVDARERCGHDYDKVVFGVLSFSDARRSPAE